jgi:hypothetical protein
VIGRIAFISVCLTSLLPASLCAAPVENEAAAMLFSRANKSYESGDYAAASGDYLKLIGSGIESGSLYYNLGNARFKEGKLGEAIYYWEKARQEMPTDPDILQNLELSHLLLVDRIDVPEDPLPVRVFNSFINLLTIGQFGWLALSLHLIANLLLAACLLNLKPQWGFGLRIASVSVWAMVILLAGILTWRVYDTTHRGNAIVVEQKVDLRSGPGSENIIVFTVHEGIRVRVRNHVQGWYQVILPNGWNGWLQQQSILIL